MAKDWLPPDLAQTLSDLIGSLEPVPYQPGPECKYETVTFGGTEQNNSAWKQLVDEHTKTARSFEIHCWAEEEDAIALALLYGTVKPMNWKYGTVIEGAVTEAFKNMLLSQPKPADAGNGYNMMTPFFTIMFDNGFSSEHYGTENHIKLI